MPSNRSRVADTSASPSSDSLQRASKIHGAQAHQHLTPIRHTTALHPGPNPAATWNMVGHQQLLGLWGSAWWPGSAGLKALEVWSHGGQWLLRWRHWNSDTRTHRSSDTERWYASIRCGFLRMWPKLAWLRCQGEKWACFVNTRG